MQKNYSIWLWLIAFSCFFVSCKKEREDTLPAATQIGAGTFGCKINGRVYIPKGSSGTGAPNPKVQYDVDLNGQPYLTIDANKFISNNVESGVLISFGNLINIGTYLVPTNFKFSAGWPEIIGACGVSTIDNSVHSFGGGIITRLDIPNRIISGTFDFKAVKPGCDTVRVTDGRFDIKF